MTETMLWFSIHFLCQSQVQLHLDSAIAHAGNQLYQSSLGVSDMISKSSHMRGILACLSEGEGGWAASDRVPGWSSELDADRSQKHLESRELDGVDDGRE